MEAIMMELKVYNIQGAVVDSVNVSEESFDVAYNEALIHQVIVAQLANKRQGTKSTLTRSEVRGGGIKPWRQKGTGRARQGSIRSPQWRHGGVVFAPKPRDFSKKVNKRMKLQALYSALSQKLRQDELFVLDNFDLAEAKTKLVSSACKALNSTKKTLIVYSGDNDNLVRASKNMPEVEVANVNLVSVYELVRANKVFFTKDALLNLNLDEEVAE